MKMKKLAVLISIIGMAGGCAAPSPVVPSGYSRTPINTVEKIENYRIRTAEEDANARERSALARQVTDLNRQLADMKTILAVLAANQAEGSNLPKPRPAPQMQTPQAQQAETAPVLVVPPAAIEPPNDKYTTSKPVTVSGRETVEIRSNVLTFRVTHAVGKTTFNPSDSLRETLLEAAANCDEIEIRGRTDADKDDEINRQIALDRALQARLYLVKSGIHPSKIRVVSLASGAFVADNSTPQGKSQNRRVEIEARGLDTTDYRISATKALRKG